MRHKLKILSLACGLIILLLNGCGGVGGDGVRVTEGTNEAENSRPRASIVARGTPVVVHVNQTERIATIRNGRLLGESFLIASDRSGQETAVLKSLPISASEGLATAEVIEGMPGINDTVRDASALRSADLAKLYRDPSQ